MAVSSLRLARFSKVLLAIFLIWLISAKVPSLFFRVSLTVDQDQEDHDGGSYGQDNNQPKVIPEAPEAPPLPPPPPPPPEHHYRDDGLVEVNPEAPHPIFELIERAEEAWTKKLQTASTSLEEAVVEYKRRYKRKPPKGFDKWWEYVKLHDVQLPDEYDQIYHDLEPFWGMNPEDLQEIQKESEEKKDSYTLGKVAEQGVITVLRTSFEEGRDHLITGGENIIALLKDISKDLPPFRATFSPHDGPNRMSDYEVKDAALAAASVGEVLTRNGLPKAASLGWLSACSPTSRARNLPDMFVQKHNDHIRPDSPAPPIIDSPRFSYESHIEPAPSTPRTKLLIYDHVKTMDPCMHPTLFWKHGTFISHHSGPAPQTYMVPEFSACTTALHHNIRIPTPYGWIDDLLESDNPEWDKREDERLMWRGSDTGIWHGKDGRWKNSHRDWLVRWANEISGSVDVLYIGDNETSTDPVGPPHSMRRARLNPAMVDMGFAGAMQCEEETCAYMAEIYPPKKRMSPKESGNYKYVMDVDGNGWSGRFKRLMTSHALIFKATIYPEWYSDRVQPWLHYVPIQVDLSDLYDALIFFRGDPNGQGAHEDLAKKIASQGREWSRTFWRKEDLVAYFYRLILEYVRIMSPDREKMNYDGDGHESWDWQGRD
ncbi:glycosyltransferase family 90 protein [Moniliophthora roreri MCA 2997]|uniref:Glycosyltransferase family 90 protein n=1 Tax=Moniliophthora roreri (strain MCA 2997) TaxID=1381753 RepID=V2XQJ5_MONRO|nr:glycosyltransferase family 90 protein [Moniliophthora roreri MCA 2997]